MLKETLYIEKLDKRKVLPLQGKYEKIFKKGEFKKGEKMNYLEITRDDMQTQKTLLYIYESALETLPKGRLHCKKKYNGLQYYLWDEEEKVQKYIRKADHGLVFELKYRHMLEEAIRTIKQNLDVQERVLKKYLEYDPRSLMRRLPDVYQDMPHLLYHPEFQDQNRENKQSYELNYKKQELMQQSTFGMRFRSKTEAVIGELVHVVKIPFLYEAKLILRTEDGNTKTYYPDFTFLPPGRGELYWDHLGRMDLEGYRKKAFKKIEDYHYNDILVPNNLILTMDDKEGGLDIGGIQRIITGQLMPLFYGADGKPLF